MAQVQKQLIASQKFLAGLLALPQYAELRGKQLERLMAVIRKVRLTVEQSGLLLAAMDSNLWDEGSISQLKSLVADQTVTETNEEQASQRVKQQDFTSLPYYLDGDWWRRLETPVATEREKNCERLCQHAARLGLTNPTEETYAFLYVLSFALQPGTLIFDCEKLQLLTQWKPVMKRHLKNAAQPPLQLMILPANVDECPKELLRAAYPQGFVAASPAQTTVEEVMRLARTWPLRKTNVVAAASKKSCYPGPLEGGQMVQAVAAATVQAVAAQLVAHVSKPKNDSDVPGLKLLIPPPEQAAKETQLALMDKPNQAGPSAHEKVDAAGLVDALQADLLQEKEPKAKHNDNVLEVFAWDEAVPGNILAPDLRRKAALTYCSFKEMPILWADTCWFTLSVCRTQDLQRIPQGYPRSMTALMEAVREETKDGFLVELEGEPELLRIKEFNILADADGIRLLTGAKGFAGLKCCFRCGHVVSGAHTDLARHEHISSRCIDRWQLHDRESLQSIQVHLHGLARKTAREKAETQLGWNLKEMTVRVLLSASLQDILPLQNILYDPMHCWASNGLIGQETGYWYAALCEKTTATLQQFKTYCKTCWNPCGGHWVDTDLLLASKLWPQDRDFKGEASASLDVLPLIVAFSHEIILPVFPCMAAEIASITALYEIICSWHAAKRTGAAARSKELAECQQKHVQCFVTAYGKRAARPKLHFSLHIALQFEQKKGIGCLCS